MDETDEESIVEVTHVYPLREELYHALDGKPCECNPKVESYAAGDVVIHKNLFQ